MRNTQPHFHASVLAFPSPSHPTLGNYEARNTFFMRHFSPPTTLLGTILNLPKPFPPHYLWTMEHPTPLFMLHFWPSQTLPNPRLGTMKRPNPFSCFILSLPKPFPPHSWEPWETPKPLLMFDFWLSQDSSHPTLGNHEKHPPPFSCFIFKHYSWEPWETPKPLFMLHFSSLPKPFPPHS